MTGRVTIFSPDRKYRYTLWREWDRDLLGIQPMYIWERGFEYVQFIGLNPSTADETKDDPTIRRCVGYAKAWGYGALVMTNLFAWRETSPTLMMKQPQPVGPENDFHLLSVAVKAGCVVIAWGKDGDYLGRGGKVRRMLKDNGVRFDCLGRCQNGEPKHPLYLPKDLTPQRWEA